MKAYVVYSGSSGELLRWGVCSDEDFEAAAAASGDPAVLEGVGTASTHWVQNGALLPYSVEQAASKQARPPYQSEWSNQSMSWVDLRGLDEIKRARWEMLRGERDALIAGGLTWGGSVFDSDAASQARIQGAVQLALLAQQLGTSYSVTWTLADNSMRTMSTQDILALGQALGAAIEAAFSRGQAAYTAIQQAQDAQAVEQVVF